MRAEWEKTGEKGKAMSDVLAELESAGFFGHTLPGNVATVKESIVKKRDLFPLPPFDLKQPKATYSVVDPVPDLTGRSYHADAEDLFEHNPVNFGMEMGAILCYWGIVNDIDSLSSGYAEPVGIWLELNGQYFVLSSKGDLSASSGYWDRHADRAFAAFNWLIARKRCSAERVYRLGCGNDCHAVILTPDQFSLIRDCDICGLRDGLRDVGEPLCLAADEVRMHLRPTH
jgi:hypothetical protein